MELKVGFQLPKMALDNKSLHCGVRKYLFCPQLSKFAVASLGDKSALELRQRDMRVLPPLRQESRYQHNASI
jgi:hypothetical protein